MLDRQFYYSIKPFIPWGVRMALRRAAARRKRELFRTTWPINEAAGTAPAGWPGWPEGRRFALVLTHDVEGPAGLAKCRRLAELEASLGFRSSFNFIPKGDYATPPELRGWLCSEGFEVGVHDLHHNGRLFRSYGGFSAKAPAINRYIREWGASGFRAGFMLRNLDWFHELGIQYDASTFDTDPFEPQSDGVGTIFPFWIPSPASTPAENPRDSPSAARITPTHPQPPPRAGYVELPYTLPQDSTLFLVLQEPSPSIWLDKLDWIAAHGGMVLLNVHPDYACFEDEKPGARTYPVAHYLALLQRLRERYAGAFWQALPRDMATYTAGLTPRPIRHFPKRICMVTHSFYETDNRVTRYAEALAARGDHVDVFSLRSKPNVPPRETIANVEVHRIQNRFGKAQQTRFAYALPLIRFLLRSTLKITRRHWSAPYDLVHVHNMPDFLVLAALYPKLTGAKVILDIHDIVPEFYANKFAGGRTGNTFRVLKWIERRSARLADHIIVSNHLWREKFAQRTGTADRCSVFINNVDSARFRPDLHDRSDGRIIILFPGGLQWHQGVDIALHAFSRVFKAIPTAEFHIYGDGIMKPTLVSLAGELGLNGSVKFFEPVRLNEIARIMANADIGVVPKRADSFGNEAYSTKIMEFMALGVPVVVSKTQIDQYYFNDSVVRFFESGNAQALADAMLAVLRDAALRRELTQNALRYSASNSWDSRKPDYLELVDSLLAGRAPKPPVQDEEVRDASVLLST